MFLLEMLARKVVESGGKLVAKATEEMNSRRGSNNSISTNSAASITIFITYKKKVKISTLLLIETIYNYIYHK